MLVVQLAHYGGDRVFYASFWTSLLAWFLACSVPTFNLVLYLEPIVSITTVVYSMHSGLHLLIIYNKLLTRALAALQYKLFTVNQFVTKIQ